MTSRNWRRQCTDITHLGKDDLTLLWIEKMEDEKMTKGERRWKGMEDV